MSRREVNYRSPNYDDGTGIELTVTRKGVEVAAQYDSGYGFVQGFALSWKELREARDRVEGRDPIPLAEAVIQLKEH